MALTRKLLKALGIEGDAADQVIEAHVESTDALKAERDQALAQLDAAKKDGWEKKYNDLKKEFDDYKAEQDHKAATEQKKAAYKELLKQAGISEKRLAAVLKASSVEDLELNKDGSLKNAADLLKGIKSEWADFIEDVKDEAAGGKENPPGAGSGKKMTREEILKIEDAGERQQAIADNHELFGF